MNDLIGQLRKKDKAAIALLYNRYGRKLYGYAMNKWHLSEDEAWEMVYKTLYKVIGVVDRYTFENEQKFNGFLFRVFINHLRNHYQEKKKKGLAFISMDDNRIADREEEPEIQGQSKDSPYMRCLKEVLEHIDDWKRILLLMKSQAYSYEEIADYIQKPADQLKVYYMRAKKVLIEKVNLCLERGNHG